MKEKNEVRVVNDQIGAPTYAGDLAAAIMTIIDSGRWIPGIYHYSNKGRISWFQFALAIKAQSHSTCSLKPISTAEFPTAARRPRFSLLDTSDLEKIYGIHPPDWEESLRKCLEELAKQ